MNAEQQNRLKVLLRHLDGGDDPEEGRHLAEVGEEWDPDRFLVVAFVVMTGRYPTRAELAFERSRLEWLGRDRFLAVLEEVYPSLATDLEIPEEELLMDITHTVGHRWLSGIQRVVREIASRLAERPGTAFARIVPGIGPVRISKNEMEAFLDRFNFEKKFSPGLLSGAVRHNASFLLQGFLPPVLVARIQKVRVARRRARMLAASDCAKFPTVLLPLDRLWICPELIANGDWAGLYPGIQRVLRKSAAVFYDAIPLTHTQFCEAGLVANHAEYVNTLREFDVVHPISETAAQDAKRYIGSHPSKTIEPVYLPADAGRKHGQKKGPTRDATPEEPLFLFVATVEVRKNHARFLLACEDLWENGYRFRVRLVGARGWKISATDAIIERLRSQGRSLDWEERFVSDEEVEKFYQEAWYSVFVSEVEGFGLPIVESLCRGVPVICSDVGSMAEIAGQCGGCLTVDPASIGSIHRALERSLTDPSLREDLVESARPEALGDWDGYCTSILSHLDDSREPVEVCRKHP